MQIRTSLYAVAVLLSLLAGCDRLGIPDKAKEAADRDADARSTGAACRHAGRAIEDCFLLNTKDDRAQVFAGWKEMDDYMRSNKIDIVKPEVAGGAAAASAASEEVITEDKDSKSDKDGKSDKSSKKKE